MCLTLRTLQALLRTGRISEAQMRIEAWLSRLSPRFAGCRGCCIDACLPLNSHRNSLSQVPSKKVQIRFYPLAISGYVTEAVGTEMSNGFVRRALKPREVQTETSHRILVSLVDLLKLLLPPFAAAVFSSNERFPRRIFFNKPRIPSGSPPNRVTYSPILVSSSHPAAANQGSLG